MTRETCPRGTAFQAEGIASVETSGGKELGMFEGVEAARGRSGVCEGRVEGCAVREAARVPFVSEREDLDCIPNMMGWAGG